MTKLLLPIKIFVSSPMDVTDEREIVTEVANDLNSLWSENLNLLLRTFRWETDAVPGVGEDSQDVLNRQIPEDYDIFIGIMKHRFGTETARFGSGTEEEFNNAYNRWLQNKDSVKILFYFSKEKFSIDEVDYEQIKKIQTFQKNLSDQGVLYWHFESLDNFRRILKSHLTRLIQEWDKGKIESTNNEELIEMPEGEIEEEDEDIGFLDLIDQSVTDLETSTEIMKQMEKELTKLNESINMNTDRLNAVEAIDDRKKVIEDIANDMDNYSEFMNKQTPVFVHSFSRAIDGYGRAAAIVPDFKSEDSTKIIEDAIETINELRSNSVKNIDSVKGLYIAVKEMPRITTRFNKSKRTMLTALDEYLSGLSNSISLLDDAEAIMQKSLEELSDKTES